MMSIFFILLFILIAALLAWLSYTAKKERAKMMRALAEELHYTYSEKGDVSTLASSLFTIGNSRKMENVFSGTLNTFPVRIFDYTFKTGIGKDARHYGFTFFEIQIGSTFPAMAISSNQEAVTSLTQLTDMIIVNGEDVRLEGNFSDFFTARTTQGRQMEVRQILAPDMMSYLMSTVPSFSFIFADGKLYICCKNWYAGTDAMASFSRDELVKNTERCQYLISKWLPVLTHMN